MTEFATRVTSIEPSETVRVSDLAGELKADGVDVLNFSSGDPDFRTPEHITRAAKRSLDDGETHYTESAGIPALREAAAEKLRTENDLSVTADEVVVTPGSKQALAESLLTLVDDGDEVVLPIPAWVTYEPLVRMAGGTVNELPMNPETGFTFEGVDVAEYVSDDTTVLILTTPSNPTGTVLSRDQLRTIRDLAIEHDFWVISDEIYEKIRFEGDHHSIGSMDGMNERTVTINGFSKAYAMTGWRLGYYTAPESLRREAGKIHSHTVSNATTFVQRAGVEALTGPQEPIEEMRRAFERRRDLIVEEFADRGIEFPTPAGAFYAYVPLGEGADSAQICEDLLTEAHVATVPGSAFGVDGYLRIAYTESEETIRSGVERIADYLNR